jgi:integrase
VEADAQRKRDELKANFWKEKQSGKKFSDALAAWLQARKRHKNQVLSVAQIQREYGDRPLIDVTGESILECWHTLHPANYNRLANIVRAALNITKELGWIEAAPKIKSKSKEEKKMRREAKPLNAKQWAKLRTELKPHLLIMADFAIATGLRWANVARMEWERIDLDRKHCWIPGSGAKAGKPISVPLSAAALMVLRRAPRPHEGFVFRYNGKPIGSGKTSWMKSLERAGLVGFHWHDLRHTWATWHRLKGTPLDVLQKLGAWESPEMVEQYKHLDPGYIASFANNSRAPRLRKAA